MSESSLVGPRIEPVPAGVQRPRWSVMIPTYNCAKYLRQTLESVLAQDPGEGEMQIEVVDDCSTKDDPEAVVREVGKGRVSLHRKPQNEGVTANFNTCIQRSRGHLLHLLHSDDWVLPGFYDQLSQLAELHPGTPLLASRSFFVDEENVIVGVTERLRALEAGAQEVKDFFYGTPVQTPGVVVRRTFYEAQGGFLPSLVHTADCEMWVRAIGAGGGVVTSGVLACYRVFATNDSGRLARTAENLRDLERLDSIFAERYPAFNRQRAVERVCDRALQQAERFAWRGDLEAAEANLAFWRQNAPLGLRLRRSLGRFARGFFR